MRRRLVAHSTSRRLAAIVIWSGIVASACGRLGFDGGAGTNSNIDAANEDATSSSDAIVGPDGEQLRGCAGQPIAQRWSFASSDSASEWTYKPNVGFVTGMTWTGAAGYPDPGELVVSVSSRSGTATPPVGWLYLPGSRDLRGRVASAWVRTNSSNVFVKIYAMNLPGNDWSDGGSRELVPSEWTCVTFDVDSPSFRDPMFDASDVQEHGIHIDAPAPAFIEVDDWSL